METPVIYSLHSIKLRKRIEHTNCYSNARLLFRDELYVSRSLRVG